MDRWTDGQTETETETETERSWSVLPTIGLRGGGTGRRHPRSARAARVAVGQGLLGTGRHSDFVPSDAQLGHAGEEQARFPQGIYLLYDAQDCPSV
eukprot:2701381-Rhodomonas_salina.2